jgi:hypothetical protein
MKKIRLLSLSFAALIALGAVGSASAWAAGAPESSSPPTLSITAPKVGTVDTVSKGSWTNSPTSYSYQWQRCNASGGECINIAGATSHQYEVVLADHGHALVGTVTATNEYGHATASSAASKAVTPLKEPEFAPEGGIFPVRVNMSGGAASFYWSGTHGVTCTSSEGSATISGPEEVTLGHLKLINCTVQGFTCGTIESLPLHGHLGYINQAADTVGLELGGEAGIFAEPRCNGAKDPIRGNIIGQITPVHSLRSSFTLTYNQRESVQQPDAFEGGPVEQLEWNSNGWGDWGLQAPLNVVTNRNVEITG